MFPLGFFTGSPMLEPPLTVNCLPKCPSAPRHSMASEKGGGNLTSLSINRCNEIKRFQRIYPGISLVIMEKLQSYKSRISFTFEGIQYQLGDFLLRVGKVVPTHSENLRGIVMEVEYLPISSIEKGKVIMDEFFDLWQEALSNRSLPGHFSHIDTNFSDFGLSDTYTPQHTAVQYACVMAQMIASVQSVQALRS
uniref:Mediator of RNA polymerase II transcription subunit 20 n=2 Tax=Kalanchoe fedtschenkoi TaxID=63787 RepID=A0A7N0UK73_KALFE